MGSTLRTCLHDYPHELRNTKVHIKRREVNMEVISVLGRSSQPGTAGYLGCSSSSAEKGTFRPAAALTASHVTGKANDADLFVDTLIDCLAVWRELAVHDACHIEECYQRDFDSLALSGLCDNGDLH